MSSWSGSKVARLAREVVETYGDTCHLCGQPGATSPDHVVPRSRGGSDRIENLLPSHVDCNLARGDWALPESGLLVRVITGPEAMPVATNRCRRGDVLIDLWRLSSALTVGPPPYSDHQLDVAEAALLAALGKAGRIDAPLVVWLTDEAPTQSRLDRYRARRWRVESTTPTQEGDTQW